MDLSKYEIGVGAYFAPYGENETCPICLRNRRQLACAGAWDPGDPNFAPTGAERRPPGGRTTRFSVYKCALTGMATRHRVSDHRVKCP